MSRVLIIPPNRLSDLVLSSIGFYPLQCAHPEIAFSLLVAEDLAPVMSSHPCFEAIINFSTGKSAQGVSKTLREKEFDTAVYLESCPVLEPIVVGASIENIIKGVALGEIPHRAEGYLRTLDQLGKPLLRSFEPWLPFDAENSVPQSYFPQLPNNYVCLNLQADRETHCWSTKAFIELTEKILQKGYPIVVLGKGARDKKQLAFMAHFQDSALIDMTGLTIGSALISVIAGGLAMVSGYSGYASLGAALGIPTVTLIGSSGQDYGSHWWAPLGAQAITLTKKISRPWWRSEARQAKKNLNAIQPDEVLKLLQRWIG